MSFHLITRVKHSAPLKALITTILLFSTSTALLLGFLYLAIVGLLESHLANSIETDLGSLIERYNNHGVAGLVTIINNKISDDSELDDYYLLATNTYERIAGNIPSVPKKKPERDGWIRTPHLLLLERTLPTGEHLYIGRDTLERRGILGVIFDAFLLALLFIIPLSLAVAAGFRRIITRLSRTVDDAARHFAAGHLSYRISNSSAGDFSAVGATLNQMFDRIEEMLHDIHHATSAIAHDLRTPLTAIRLQIEQLRSTHPQAHDECCRLISAVDRVIDLFNAHLRITEVDAGARKAAFAHVDLDVIVGDAIAAYEGVSDEKSQILTQNLAPIRLWADADLVFQAVCNLIDNAIKFSPKNCRIDIKTLVVRDFARIIISDNGPGIPSGSAPKITERFTKGLNLATSGSGLGLALVAAVAREHDGKLDFTDNYPGLKVTLDLKIEPN